MKTGLYDFGGGVTAFVDCEDPEERWVRYLCEQQMAQAEIEQAERARTDAILAAIGAEDEPDEDLVEIKGLGRVWDYDIAQAPAPR